MEQIIINELSNAEQITAFVEKTTAEITDGLVNPLEAFIRLTAAEKAIGEIKKRIRSNVMAEVGKYKENSFSLFSARIEKAEVGTKYDFANCGDPEYVELATKEKEIAESKKQRETFLKAIKGKLEIVIPESGETYTIYPPAKSSDSFIKVTIK